MRSGTTCPHLEPPFPNLSLNRLIYIYGVSSRKAVPVVPVVQPRLPQGLQGGTTFSLGGSAWFQRFPNLAFFPPIRLWARLYPQFCKTLLIRISSRFPMRSGFSPIASRKTSLARKNSQFRGSSLVIRSGVSSHFSTVSSQASLMVYCSWTLAASCSASRNWIPPRR